MREQLTFGEMLKAFRKRRKLSQRVIATKLGVHYNTIWAWERGDYLPDTKGMVLELAHHLALADDEVRQLLEASLTGLLAYWFVPFQRNPFFTGKEEFLSTIHELLHSENGTDIGQSIAIHGLGGIGKTQLVIEYCYRYHHNFSAVLWFQAETVETLYASFRAVGDVLDLPEHHEDDVQKIVQAVHRWLRKRKEWLLIFDNVEDIELLQPFLPANRQGSMIYTTRHQSLGATARMIESHAFSLEEGVTFLLHRSQLQLAEESLRQEECVVAEALVIEVQGLPLALEQAAAYIADTGCCLADYVDLFRQRHQILLSLDYDPGGNEISLDHVQSVVITFQLAFEKVQQKSIQASKILLLCAFLYPDAIPEDLLNEGAAILSDPDLKETLSDLGAFNSAMAVIRSMALLQREPRTKMLHIHRLIQTVLRIQMTRESQRYWAETVVHLVNDAFPDVRDLRTWKKCQRFLLQSQACVQFIQEQKIVLSQAGYLMGRVGDFLGEQNQHQEAIQMLEKALVIQIQSLGDNHPDLARTYNALGNNYYLLNSYDQAEQCFQKGLTLSQQRHSSYPLEYEMSLSNLGMLYLSKREYIRAQTLLQQALSAYALLSDFPLEMARTLDSMGGLYFEQENYQQALEYFFESYQLRRRLLPSDHLYLSMNLGQLAITEIRLGQGKEAEYHLLEALYLLERIGATPTTIAATHHTWLGILYKKQERFVLAEQHMQTALAMSTEIETGVRNKIHYHFNLAELYTQLENYDDAEIYINKCMQMHALYFHGDKVIETRIHEAYTRLLRATKRDQETIDRDINNYDGTRKLDQRIR